MEEYKSNSHKVKAEKAANERKRLEKVIDGTAKVKKKNGVNKFTDTFISEDFNNVKSYILMDVLVPALKKAISDIVVNGIDMMLYGETRRDRKGSYNSNNVSYRNYYEHGRDDRDRDRFGGSRLRSTHYFDDVYVDTRGEAEEVLDRLDEAIDTYGVVSIADLYDLVGITPAHTDFKYGWTNIRNAEAVRVRDKYLIKMPKALPID